MMNELSKNELQQITGGGIGIGLMICAGIVFIIGVIDGYVRPLKCNK
ncbi:MAG: class IIb bacteriocin, lactobin A/cerein 7B family [Ignavibacteriales bacterium]